MNLSNTQIKIAAGAAVALAALLVALEVKLDLAIVRLSLIGAGAGTGFFLGWLASPDGKKARRIVAGIAAAMALIVALFDGGAFGWSTAGLLTWIAFFAALFYWLGAAARGFLQKPTTFGSAEWATGEYLLANNLVGEEGIALGRFTIDGKRRTVRYAGDRHLLTIAPTRAGKGTTAIIPNLLTYRGSAMVIDPKGENATITAAARRAMGQEIFVVDPWTIAPAACDAPARFNPLDWLEMGDIDMTENAMLLADALAVPSDKGERFWTEEAKALLQGLILYVATDEREKDNRSLARVRDLLLLDGEDMPLLFQRMTDSAHHVVASTGARCLQKEEKLLANVIASAQAETHFLDSPRIRDSLSASDFKFEDLKRKAMTIYLVLPADRLDTFGRWLRLLIQQAITVAARSIDEKPPQPVLFLLDEMPALGRLSSVETGFGLLAGFGTLFWGIVQDASQLRRIYGEGWETFIGNSGVVQYFGSRDRMTADYFSALCGVTTVWNLTSAMGRAFSTGKNGSTSSQSFTQTTATAQRKLAYPDELMRLHSSRQLVLIENHHPIMAEKVRWFEDDALKLLGTKLIANDDQLTETTDGETTSAALQSRRA